MEMYFIIQEEGKKFCWTWWKPSLPASWSCRGFCWPP